MDQLDLGVARGIITAAQRDALRALSGDVASGQRVEAPRALNAVTIAYWVGGIAVLAAFGWFLVSRWAVLGPGGVLVVALVYAGLFALMARVFQTHGFNQAAAVATLLIVGMTPLVAWALLSLSGLWSLIPETQPLYFQLYEPVWKQLRWMPIDLATILVSLIALRRVPFGVLALPIALALAALGSHSVFLFIEPEMANALGGRLPLVLAIVTLSIAYALDTRTSGDEDYAIWFYLVGLGALIAALAQFWGESAGWAAHAVLGISAIFAYAALRLGRRLLLFGAFVGFVTYLGYLAFDVFKKTLEFPVALATLGIVVILSAVLLQRRYPALVRATATLPRNIPGAPLALGGALVIAIALIAAGIPDARQRIADRYWREAFERRRMHNRSGPRARPEGRARPPDR